MLPDYPKKWKILSFLAGIVFLSTLHLSAQTTNLYTENFNYSDGTTTSAQWTLDVSQCNLSGANSHFDVLAQAMEGRNLNGEAVWRSSVTSITGYQQVNMSLSLTRTGTMTISDYIKVSYILDNGTETPFTTNGSMTGTFAPVTASQNGLSGSTLQIIVRVKNNSAGKKHRFNGKHKYRGCQPCIGSFIR